MQPPNEVRGFVHKRILGRALTFGASFVPGGSTVLAVGKQLLSSRRAPPPPLQLPRRFTRPPVSVRIPPPPPDGDEAVGIRQMLRLPPSRPPSIPPVNPVREAAAALKPLPPVRIPRPRQRIPQVAPVIDHRPAVAPPIRSFVEPTRRAPMPVHRRAEAAARRFFPNTLDRFAPASIRAPREKRCIWPSHLDAQTGQCIVGTMAGRDVGPGEVGDAVMGRYGAAYFPSSMLVDRAVCLPGDVVGDDGLCYPKGKKGMRRMHPPGRKPLLTGGDMKAIARASRAAGRLERTTKRLQKLGMIKKPASRARAATKLPAHQHQITSGG